MSKNRTQNKSSGNQGSIGGEEKTMFAAGWLSVKP
jgi:hypothetical protein